MLTTLTPSTCTSRRAAWTLPSAEAGTPFVTALEESLEVRAAGGRVPTAREPQSLTSRWLWASGLSGSWRRTSGVGQLSGDSWRGAQAQRSPWRKRKHPRSLSPTEEGESPGSRGDSVRASRMTARPRDSAPLGPESVYCSAWRLHPRGAPALCSAITPGRVFGWQTLNHREPRARQAPSALSPLSL